MKLQAFFIFIVFSLGTTIFAQTTFFVPAPANNGSTTGLRAPNGTAAQTTLRAHFIIQASELAAIPTGTVITDLGVNLSSGAIGTASGNLHFYLENTANVSNNKSLDWTIATTSMNTVYNGAFVIPTVAGTSDFTLTNTFTYTGGGIYVAYEYIGTTFATTGAVYLSENTLPNSCKTGATANNTPLAVLNGSSDWRPEIRFGYSNPYSNDIAIINSRPDFGKVNKLLQSSSSVEVTVMNSGSAVKTNIPVTLSVTGANTHFNSQTILSLAPGVSEVLVFSGIPTINSGTQIVQAYVSPDQLSTNDTLSFSQEVNCDTLNHTNNDGQDGSIGWGVSAGIIASKYDLPAGLSLNVKTIDISISSATTNLNNTIKAVLLNSNGIIMDSSSLHTIGVSDLGTNLSLPLLNGSADYSGETVYLGIRQTANASTAYSPVGTQASVIIPDSMYCSFVPSGGTVTYYTNFGAFMIGGTIEPSPLLAFSSINGSLCSGSNAAISIYPPGFDNYSLFLNGGQTQSNTSGNFSISPIINSSIYIESETNSCVYVSNSLNINVVTEFQNSINAAICAGDTYSFYGQNLSTAGQYIDTVVVPGSCDTIVTLNLAVAQPSASTISAIICEGSIYQFDGLNISVEGTYTAVIPNMAGCDSIMTLNLSFHPVDAGITQNSTTLTVNENANGVTYQWIDCNNNNTPIPGQVGQSFTPTIGMGIIGSYAVVVTKDSCVKTSDCITVDLSGLNDINSSTLSIYPIPTTDFINISTSLQELKSFTIYDMSGKVVFKDNIANQTITEIDVSELESGTYLLELNGNYSSVKKVFVKQ